MRINTIGGHALEKIWEIPGQIDVYKGCESYSGKRAWCITWYDIMPGGMHEMSVTFADESAETAELLHSQNYNAILKFAWGIALRGLCDDPQVLLEEFRRIALRAWEKGRDDYRESLRELLGL